MGPRPLSVSRPELLIGGSDRTFRQFLHAFMVFARRLEAIRDVLARAIGVTAPQYEILSHLRQSAPGDGITVGELAERLHCTGAFSTTEVGKLVALGLVIKRRDPGDARKVRVSPTPRCEQRFRSIAPLQRRLNDALFASITAEQFSVLSELFPHLADDGDRAVALGRLLSASGIVVEAELPRLRGSR
jgi:MarR family transcriptional regulator, organic hydroperoxide resistance regulator